MIFLQLLMPNSGCFQGLYPRYEFPVLYVGRLSESTLFYQVIKTKKEHWLILIMTRDMLWYLQHNKWCIYEMMINTDFYRTAETQCGAVKNKQRLKSIRIVILSTTCYYMMYTPLLVLEPLYNYNNNKSNSRVQRR